MSKKVIYSPDFVQGLGILQGWQEIGRYLGRSGRTARRWFDNYGMPVRQAVTGRPFALINELDRWMVKVDEIIKKEGLNEPEKQRQHAAMMRSAKKTGNLKVSS